MVLQGSGKHHPKSFEIQGQNISEHNMSFSVYTLKFIEEWNEILPELRGVVQLRLVFVQQVHGKLLHGPEIHKKKRLQMITFLMHRFRLESAGRKK